MTTRRSGVHPRREDQERHVQLAAVETEAVPGEPALLKVLAVVGGDDDQRVFKQPPASQLIEEAADLVVEIGDAAVVAINQDVDGLPLKSRSLRGPRSPKTLSPG